MKTLTLRIYLTVVAVLLLFAVASGWLFQQQIETERIRSESALPERMDEALAGVKQVLVVEQNHGAQLLRYLRAMFDLPGRPASFHRPGPLPLRPAELTSAIVDWAHACGAQDAAQNPAANPAQKEIA